MKGRPNDRSINRLRFNIIAVGYWSCFTFNYSNSENFLGKIITSGQSLQFFTCLRFPPCCWYTLNYEFAQGSLMLCGVSQTFIAEKTIISWLIIGRLWPWLIEHRFGDQFHSLQIIVLSRSTYSQNLPIHITTYYSPQHIQNTAKGANHTVNSLEYDVYAHP